MQNARIYTRKGNFVRIAVALATIFSTTLALPALAVTQSVLHSFAGPSADGSTPNTALIQGTDGNFYGVTNAGGPNTCGNTSCGTVFKMTSSGATTILHNFHGSDGSNPSAALVQGTDGNLYGTTFDGGANGSGTVFKISTSGTFTSLYSFATVVSYHNIDGANPDSALIQYSDGNFYGTTLQGAEGGGTIFKITPTGQMDILYKFVYGDGELPAAGVIRGIDGNLYGATLFYGPNGGGTIYKFDIHAAKLTTLYAFSNADGAYPDGRLVQAADGTLYGTTYQGGTGNNGTVFKLSPSGTLTTLRAFTASPDGQTPYAGLVLLNNGNVYGTTQQGGSINNGGTVFTINSNGGYGVLHSFGGPDGFSSKGGLVLGKDGALYGTTEYGGTASIGSIYKLTGVLPAAWISPTPADSTDFDLTITQPFSQVIQANELDSDDTARITASSLPSGSSLPTVTGNPAKTTLQWTPGNGQAGDYSIKINAASVRTPVLAAETRTIKLHVHKRGTSIAVSPTLLQLTPLQLTLRMRATLAATLPTQALAGKVVAFTTPNGQALCSATTNASGTATCDAVIAVLSSTLSLGYVAKFAEDGSYLGSSAKGSLIK